MTRSRALPSMVFGLVASVAASADQGEQPAKREFPCAMSDYRVAAPSELRIRCRVPLQEPVAHDGDLVEVDDDGQWIEQTRRDVRLTSDLDEKRWIRATLPSDALLAAGKTYALRTKVTYEVNGTAVPYERQAITISTKPVTAVFFDGRNAACRELTGRLYVMAGRIAIESRTLEVGTLTEDPNRRLAARFCGYGSNEQSSDVVGRARVVIGDPGPEKLNSHFTLGGVTDVFGSTVVIPAKQRLKMPGAPKDKDSAAYYFRFLHQATDGTSPGYAADLKLAPEVKNLGGGVFLRPELLADVGLRKVEDVKVSDMIKAGLGVTKIFTRAGAEAIQLTPAASFETDRTWHHRNVLLDVDAQFFGGGWLQSIALQNERAYARKALEAVNAGDDPPDPESLPSATWGWQLQAFVGGEIGRALSQDEAKSSDEATTVEVPAYPILRVRPKIAAMIEYKRFSITGAVVPRILFRKESVTRERVVPAADDPTESVQQIYVEEIDGWRAFAEVTVNWQLDVDGHYLLTAAYKSGRQPPNFDEVKTVQSGVTIRF